jgi:hypothetical protein
MLVVLYRLLEKDFDAGRAYRTALYLSVYPMAFFFATAYNESLFLLLILLLPFYYEYIHQHRFNLRTMRFDCLAGALIPAGLGLYSLYCYFQAQDALAFSHAESHWNRNLHAPWQAFIDALRIIQPFSYDRACANGILFPLRIRSFSSLHRAGSYRQKATT